MSTKYISVSIRTVLMIAVMFFLSACNSSDNGRPNTTTNITVIADLPSNISRLIDGNRDVQAQLEYGTFNQKMNFIIDGTAENTINNYDRASINVKIRFSVDVNGTSVELARANRLVNTISGSIEIISVTQYLYLDTDNDGFSNLIEIINNSNYNDSNSYPFEAIKPPILSANYSIERTEITKLNYSPISNSYSINNTTGEIFSVSNGISRSLKQFSGISLYEIKIN